MIARCWLVRGPMWCASNVSGNGHMSRRVGIETFLVDCCNLHGQRKETNLMAYKGFRGKSRQAHIIQVHYTTPAPVYILDVKGIV